VPNLESMTARCPALDALRRSVASAAAAGASLDEIDDTLVRPAALDEERRSALWLYAWLHVEGCSAAFSGAA